MKNPIWVERQNVSIEKEINVSEIPEGITDEKATMTSSTPDIPLANASVERTAKVVIVHITSVSMKTSKAPQTPC